MSRETQKVIQNPLHIAHYMEPYSIFKADLCTGFCGYLCIEAVWTNWVEIPQIMCRDIKSCVGQSCVGKNNPELL